MTKLEELFEKENSLMDKLADDSLSSVARPYYTHKLSMMREAITKEETRIVKSMNEYEEAMLVLNTRVSKFDNADDINEALIIAKEALSKQIRLIKYISGKDESEQINICKLKRIMESSDDE